jgi:hypothetical protein
VSAEERVQFAKLNNICAEKGITAASFDSALTCVRSAHRLISPDLENLPEVAELARSIYLNLIITLYRLIVPFDLTVVLLNMPTP